MLQVSHRLHSAATTSKGRVNVNVMPAKVNYMTVKKYTNVIFSDSRNNCQKMIKQGSGIESMTTDDDDDDDDDDESTDVD